MPADEKLQQYTNRDLSWLQFNGRVLEESENRELPVLDRLRFLGISASNLDEFYMVRVAKLIWKSENTPEDADLTGMLPRKRLELVTQGARAQMERQYALFLKSLLPSLKAKGICLPKMDRLSPKQMDFAGEYFQRRVYPVLTPLAVDASRPFPLLKNRRLNLAAKLAVDGETQFGVIQVPANLSRFVEVPWGTGRGFVLLEELIQAHLGELFGNAQIISSVCFRVTRGGNLELDEAASDMLEEISDSLLRRKRAKPVRLEVGDARDEELFRFLTDSFGVSHWEVYAVAGPLDLGGIAQLSAHPDFPSLRGKKHIPVPPRWLEEGKGDIFRSIREKDRLLHLPFDAFDPVVKLARQAAEDDKVLAVKQILYRVSGDSTLVAALARAAERGKQVTVLMELRARFDEENNIHWAKRLERAGCHVIYGLSGLKVHCKAMLVIRREEEGIRRYVHLGTGNYNDATATQYTDFGLFTAKEKFGRDVAALFDTLTGYSPNAGYRKLVTAPEELCSFLKEMISREKRNARNGLAARIVFKVNSLSEKNVIDALYETSRAGVKIELIVRGICCLVPGIPGRSENITVRSLVGRFLEHSRIFYFENGGEPQIYLGSADLMPRNLHRRVESLFPIEDPELKTQVTHILDLYLADNKKARIMEPDGSYHAVPRQKGQKIIDAQLELLREAAEKEKPRHT